MYKSIDKSLSSMETSHGNEFIKTGGAYGSASHGFSMPVYRILIIYFKIIFSFYWINLCITILIFHCRISICLIIIIIIISINTIWGLLRLKALIKFWLKITNQNPAYASHGQDHITKHLMAKFTGTKIWKFKNIIFENYYYGFFYNCSVSNLNANMYLCVMLRRILLVSIFNIIIDIHELLFIWKTRSIL